MRQRDEIPGHLLKKNLRMKKNYSPRVAYLFQFSFLSSFLLDGKSQPFCDIKYPSPRFPLSFLPSAHKKERRKSAQEEVFGVWVFFGLVEVVDLVGPLERRGRRRRRRKRKKPRIWQRRRRKGGRRKIQFDPEISFPSRSPPSLPLPTRSNEIAEVS